MQILLQTVATIFLVDFVSGFFHWLEDAYGNPDWPITGKLVTRPNILHHHDPRHFTKHTWFQSSWDLLCLGALIVLVAWISGLLTWQVWLFAILGVNANQIHKWAHRTPAENGAVISFLQRMRLVQSCRHHAGHHHDPKTSRYCVLTNFLNPLLDGIGFWTGLEKLIWALFRVQRRPDASQSSPALAVALVRRILKKV